MKFLSGRGTKRTIIDGFDAYGAEQWLDQFAAIKSSNGVILSTSRDHA
jgi:hypothetical protein